MGHFENIRVEIIVEGLVTRPVLSRVKVQSLCLQLASELTRCFQNAFDKAFHKGEGLVSAEVATLLV